MKFFSNLFSNEDKSAEQKMAARIAKFELGRRELIIRLAQKVMAASPADEAILLGALRQFSDFELLALPEASVVTMAAIYRKLIAEGVSNEDALLTVDATRALKMATNASLFPSVEDYLNERLKVDLAAADARTPILKFYTRDFIAYCVQETNLLVRDTLGY